jgi:hypothetical protein
MYRLRFAWTRRADVQAYPSSKKLKLLTCMQPVMPERTFVAIAPKSQSSTEPHLAREGREPVETKVSYTVILNQVAFSRDLLHSAYAGQTTTCQDPMARHGALHVSGCTAPYEKAKRVQHIPNQVLPMSLGRWEAACVFP